MARWHLAGRYRFTVSKPVLKAPKVPALKLQYDETLSNFAFNIALRHYNLGEISANLLSSLGPGDDVDEELMHGRGLHSFIFQLNLSAFGGIGGSSRGCLWAVHGLLRAMRGCAFVSGTAQAKQKSGRV